MNSQGFLLETRDLSRYFGGVRAVDGVNLAIRSGQIFGLIGPNGAGKTTVINVISGLLPATRGRIIFRGRDIGTLPSHRRAALGLTRTYQNIRLFKGLTAREHLVIAQHTRLQERLWERVLFLPKSRQETARANERADELLGRVGLAGQAGRIANDLSYGDQRRLEIGRALATDPSLILLDEPAAGMNETEAQTLRTLITSIAAEGRAVVLVEHHVELVLSLCERVAVMNFGQLLAEGIPSAIRSHPDVVAAYLGVDDQ